MADSASVWKPLSRHPWVPDAAFDLVSFARHCCMPFTAMGLQAPTPGQRRRGLLDSPPTWGVFPDHGASHSRRVARAVRSFGGHVLGHVVPLRCTDLLQGPAAACSGRALLRGPCARAFCVSGPRSIASHTSGHFPRVWKSLQPCVSFLELQG